MRLYPSFREALKSGRVNLDGPMEVLLVSCDYDPSHKAPADVAGCAVAPERPLGGTWEGGGEDEAGDPLPKTLTAPDTLWENVEKAPSGCVILCGDVLVGYYAIPEDKRRPGEPWRLQWPKGVLILE